MQLGHHAAKHSVPQNGTHADAASAVVIGMELPADARVSQSTMAAVSVAFLPSRHPRMRRAVVLARGAIWSAFPQLHCWRGGAGRLDGALVVMVSPT